MWALTGMYFTKSFPNGEGIFFGNVYPRPPLSLFRAPPRYIFVRRPIKTTNDFYSRTTVLYGTMWLSRSLREKKEEK